MIELTNFDKMRRKIDKMKFYWGTKLEMNTSIKTTNFAKIQNIR